MSIAIRTPGRPALASAGLASAGLASAGLASAGLAALAALAALAIAPRAAAAQTVFHACYVPASGTVYRIKATNTPQNCLQPTHVAFSWTDGAGGGGGVSEHADLAGLLGDDHPQYLLLNGLRSNVGGFAMRGVLGATPSLMHTFPLTESGFLWHPAKGALRVGTAAQVHPWTDANIGLASFAAGRGTLASGETSLAFGNVAIASGISSVALGTASKATGDFSFAVGDHSEATGEGSFAVGRGKATAYQSVSFGQQSEATAAAAFAIAGRATGESSVAIGVGANTNGKKGAVVIAPSKPAGSVLAADNGQFVVAAPHIFFGNNATPYTTPDRFIETGPGAYLSSGGTWTNSSDSTVKTAFRAVDNDSILARIAELPIYTWQYKAERAATRHMGPTAQAFRKAFGLGDTDKAISTVDIDGVSLAGVKALEARTKSLKAETIALRQENVALTARIEQLEAMVARLVANSTPNR